MKALEELYNSEGEEGEDEEVVSPAASGSKMVGLSDQYNDLKQRLIHGAAKLQVVSLVGMAGIGKTTLATKIFEDRDILRRFKFRVWVTVGIKCRSKEIPRHILGEVSTRDSDQVIARRLNKSLKGKRYLIVLDDIWDKCMSECFQTPVYSRRRKEMMNHFPDEQNGSRLLLISRLQDVGIDILDIPRHRIEMRLMKKEESWHLLREKVFADQQESCPSQLERHGRKIAERCEGLPLTVVAVAKLLSKLDKTAQCWNEVATRKNHQLFKTAYDEISKVLLSSYSHLPRRLQMCFLFFGVFPQKYEIPRSKLINMWNGDGFLGLNQEEFPDLAAIQCLEELVSDSMLMICKNTINANWEVIGHSRIKACRLHSSLWHLSNREATRIKFSHVLNSLDDVVSGEGIKRQHRLSFHNNILFGIKEVNESVEEDCASTAHSVLCYGPYLPYQVPICFGLRLLRELDALAIRFYEFPMEVLQLVELRYLALTLNGKLPTAISQLSNLRFLIVDPHLSIIKLCEDDDSSSYLPMEIWNMKELQHLEVGGKDLPNPCGASLHSLSTLSGVSPNSCTEDVFRAIPNVERLGVQVELSPDHDDGEPLSCLAHVSHLFLLTSFKCAVVNPCKAVPFFAPLSTFPSLLKKLSLSGLGYAWEDISAIASLELLKVLKLRNYAFRGAEWEVRKKGFPSLRSLVIEDTDLVKWKIGRGSLRWLNCLIIKRGYKLKEIHGGFGESLKEIEIVDCNPLGAERMKKAAASPKVVRVSCSWYDEKPKA